MSGDLNSLAAAAALAAPTDPASVSSLAGALAAWLRAAAESDPFFAEALGAAERVLEGLKRGFDPGQGLERLCRLIDRAQERLAGSTPPQPHGPQAALDEPVFLSVEGADVEGWRDFMIEAPELLQAVETPLVAALRQEPVDPLELLRPLHTLKGVCGMLGLAGMNRLMHACEELLQPHRGSTSLPKQAAEAVLAACDLLRAQVDGVAAGLDQGGFRLLEAAPLIQALDEAARHAPGAGSTAFAASEAEGAARVSDNHIRIPVSKMDGLLEAVSELAICQAQVTRGVLELGLHSSLSAETGRLEKISRQLQEAVLSLRMVPVSPLFNRISRQAHELSRRVGKPLRVELEGGETEMDKGLVEDLFEPLLHLVRNALDHGLDTPEERRAAGKPEQGLLRLEAFHQGGEFVLRLSDDGRGFDLAAIASKARAQGRLKPQEEPSPERLLELLFEPGFSTARAVTDLSGRGVGLDAVRQRVQDLKGSVKAEAGAEGGAVFTMRLPLTMALMEAILVRAGGERYALPASSVLRFLAWDADGRHAVGQGKAWFEAAGRSLPLVELGAEGGGRSVAMHVSAGGKEACLLVDEVLGKQQLVVKALGGLLKDTPGLGGGAVLADGRVGLILDLESLLKLRALA